MVDLAQLVRASDCGSEGRGFEPHIPPFHKRKLFGVFAFFIPNHYCPLKIVDD